ncbi:contractile injection system protein, VgrG/Pvc8 family [Neisseria sp. DTU_2020_1000833_1_SI_GRL_NUU_006]|uniref:contractile injection system protein, VgrG/Pvc8 family n=1 Tax=Neisseria sp. HMSC065D04 TaxID=1739542 RepID=UPI0008A1C087|nr:contractile injection system protein, VgrG/Pvc8 family [Neisseria sp. HMSC065D04]OFO35335.1 late control protein [Neisseria sp. HMSC065D04]WNU97825.1 contractile injection system protein, VgrG/Pvc8 family [Neisseria sp. DTU_2020_1000833_1_SI_GRL_NUU_006]
MTILTTIKDQAVKIFNAITDTGGNHLTPVAKLSINGKPFNTDALSRIISISLTDKSGFEADELTVSLSDHDGALALPPKSAEITIALGYIETGIVDKGSYKITEVSWSGAPDTLHITAQSADTSDRFSEAKEKSWHKTSLKEIIESIAAANGYTPIIGKAYQEEKIDHIDQSNESDAAFLSRLAERYDAIATVKHGRLLFVSSGEATTASGQPLPTIRITRNSGDQYTFRYSNTESYNAVRAYYIDKQTGKKHEVVITEDNYDPVKKTVTTTKKYKTKRKDGKTHKTTTKEVTEIKQADTTGKKIKTLRHTYQSPKTAATGARAAYKKLKRGAMEFDISLAVGRPDIAPESPVTLQGFKPEIDAEKWVGKETVHTLDGNGLTTAVKLQSLIDVPIVLYEGEVSPNFAAAVSKP